MKFLILFDHDGTLCLTNENAYESIKFAVREACYVLGISSDPIENDWDKMFRDTRGTTEKTVTRYVYTKLDPGGNHLDRFNELYILARANWYKNMKTYNNYIYDTYYPDAENLLYYCYKNENTMIGMLTGNPKTTIEVRLAAHLYDIIFDKQSASVFGDECDTRSTMIKLAIERAEKLDKEFKVERNESGFAKNVIYVADSQKDFSEGLIAKVRMVWVPSRMLQTVEDARGSDEVKLLKSVLPEKTFLITNNLELQETISFILGE